MKTILVPTDFSKNADNAFRYAIALAKETKSKIFLLHVYDTAVLYAGVPMVTAQMDYAIIRNSALNQLKKCYEKTSAITAGVTIELVLQEGLPSARIKELALEKKADLIVMGTTGRGSIERTFMGSNASRVIRNAPCMVMLVPPKAGYKGLNSIVYATDLVNENIEHANTLIPFAKTFNSEILFLNINAYSTENVEDTLKRITRKIKRLITYSKTSGYVCNDINIGGGINYFLKKHEADCLAMYTHHRSVISGIFNPSITKLMALHTSIPLLVIHEKDFAEII